MNHHEAEISCEDGNGVMVFFPMDWSMVMTHKYNIYIYSDDEHDFVDYNDVGSYSNHNEAGNDDLGIVSVYPVGKNGLGLPALVPRSHGDWKVIHHCAPSQMIQLQCNDSFLDCQILQRLFLCFFPMMVKS